MDISGDGAWGLAEALEELALAAHLAPGKLTFDFALPMPSVSYLELVPEGPGIAA